MPAAWQLLSSTITFLTSTVAVLRPRKRPSRPSSASSLLAANSLFTLTLILSQVLGLVVLGTLAISLLQTKAGSR